MSQSLNIVVIEDIEQWIKKNLVDITLSSDNASVCVCVKLSKVSSIRITILDKEENIERVFNFEQIVTGFKKFAQLVQNGVNDKISGNDLHKLTRWYGSGWESLEYIKDPSNWDVESTDAFLQCIMYGEVIYG